MNQYGRWLTVTQAAAQSPYSVAHIRKLVKDGDVRYRKGPGPREIYYPSLMKYLKSRKARKGQGKQLSRE